MEIFILSIIMGGLLAYFVWANEYGYRKHHECDIDHEEASK